MRVAMFKDIKDELFIISGYKAPLKRVCANVAASTQDGYMFTFNDPEELVTVVNIH